MTLQIICFGFGAILLTLGIFRRVKSKVVDIDIQSQKYLPAILIIVGIVFISLSVFLFIVENKSKGSTQPPVVINTGSTNGTPNTNAVNPPVEHNTDSIDTDVLIIIIREQQKSHVKMSVGPEAYQCFTDNDLTIFNTRKTVDQILQQLKKDDRFMNVVLAIKRMDKNKQNELLAKAATTYKLTWAQIGKVDSTGQTVAGQQAEKAIATGIVDLIKKLLPLSENEIEKAIAEAKT